MDDPTKAGAAISRRNMTRLQSMHDMAVEMGAQCEAADYTPIGKSDMCPHCGQSLIATEVKAGALAFEDDPTAIVAEVKALGDRTLELRVAWGWDNHKEQFHPEQTDFDLENFPTPPVAYYHGYNQSGKKAPKPIYIGRTVKRENRTDGHYLITKLNNKPEADRVWAAALKGEAVVSPATAGHLIRKEADGTLTYWPIVEISAWDYAPTRKQAHPNSRAFPILKALYLEAGIPLPASLDTTPPEAAGDAASADDLSPEAAAQYIVTQVAGALIARQRTT